MRITSIGDLEVYPTAPGTAQPASVPLDVVSDLAQTGEGSRLYARGVVWEDEPYEMSFELVTRYPVRRAALSVNGGSEMRMRHVRDRWGVGSGARYWYRFETNDRVRDHIHTHPFAFTCGFARVQVSIHYRDDVVETLVSQDIVSLDEPHGRGPSGDKAEEENVRQTLMRLVRPERNQAAEWMFSRETTSVGDRPLSNDVVTDWAYAPIAARLQAASDAMDLVYDGIEDPFDAFPNDADPSDADARGPHDTPENRAVRALLTSMLRQQERVSERLCAMLEATTRDHRLVDTLIADGEAIRGRRQTLPAKVVFAEREVRERELLNWAADIKERVFEAMDEFDDPTNGMGPVKDVPFRVPEPSGLFESDHTYRDLRQAMRAWRVYAGRPLERRDLSLHTARPDRIFEYAALHRMLSWLHENGFVENESFERAIDHFRYSLEDDYDFFENDERCANTFRLARVEQDGRRTEADLLYQPVVYADRREENGVRLHRVAPDDGTYASSAFWTPDYILVVRTDTGSHTYVLDTKYCRHDQVQPRMRDCIEKYARMTSATWRGPASTGVDGIVLLVGRLDTTGLHAVAEPGEPLEIVCALHNQTSRREVTELFEALGIPPTGEDAEA